MAAIDDTEALAATVGHKVAESLRGTRFETTSLVRLTGGISNYAYRGRLLRALGDDGPDEVLVKHGEEFFPGQPTYKTPRARCRIEEACMRNMILPPLSSSSLAPTALKGLPALDFDVRIPKFYHCDEETKTQVHEYFSNNKDLFAYAVPRFAGTDARGPSMALGNALGRWLRGLHDWSRPETHVAGNDGDTAAKVRRLREQILHDSDETRRFKNYINYGLLMDRVKEFPAVLGRDGVMCSEVAAMARLELEGSGEGMVLVHGDFRVANILVRDAPITTAETTELCVVDWEFAQLGVPALDLGQIIGDMYMMFLARGMDAGLSMVEGLVAGYSGKKNQRGDHEAALRTAVQMGVHLIALGTAMARRGMFGDEATDDQTIERIARRGRDLLVLGWRRDVDGLREDVVGRLLLGL